MVKSNFTYTHTHTTFVHHENISKPLSLFSFIQIASHTKHLSSSGFGFPWLEPYFTSSCFSNTNMLCWLNIFESLWHFRKRLPLWESTLYSSIGRWTVKGPTVVITTTSTIRMLHFLVVCLSAILYFFPTIKRPVFLLKMSVSYFFLSWRITRVLVSQNYAIIMQNPLTSQ